MICKNCGKTINDDSRYCSHCGAKVNSDPRITHFSFNSVNNNATIKKSGITIFNHILGIFSFFLSFIMIGLMFFSVFIFTITGDNEVKYLNIKTIYFILSLALLSIALAINIYYIVYIAIKRKFINANRIASLILSIINIVLLSICFSSLNNKENILLMFITLGINITSIMLSWTTLISNRFNK